MVAYRDLLGEAAVTDRETPLQMATRHVAEAKLRLARQERLISKLENDGHVRMLPSARALHGQMSDFLRVCRAHRDYEAAKHEGKTDEAGLQRLLGLMSTTGIEPILLDPE